MMAGPWPHSRCFRAYQKVRDLWMLGETLTPRDAESAKQCVHLMGDAFIDGTLLEDMDPQERRDVIEAAKVASRLVRRNRAEYKAILRSIVRR